MIEATLYTSNAFYLESYRTHDGQLLNGILREQLATLPDCVAVLHDSFIGYYHNGFLVATEPIGKYALPLIKRDHHLVDANGR